MFSSPPGERRRRGPAGWSLRTRLLAILVGVVAVLCLVIGVVTEVALYNALLDRTDRQLDATAERSLRDLGGPGGPGPRGRPGGAGLGPPVLSAFGQSPGTLAATVVGGRVRARDAAFINADDQPEALPPPTLPELARVPQDGKPHTMDLTELGPYRLRVIRPQGTNGYLIVGLPLADAWSTLYAVAAVEAILALAALLTVALGGAAAIRLALRPLHRVAASASRIAELPLDSGDVALAPRVSDVDTDPGTEVGQVGAALNRMLGHIDAAFAARQASEGRLRQFVADASHELRTPLAAIRGYAELGRRRADEVPAEVAQVLDRVESQATRMTTLVEDLLLLARLDAGRPLEDAPVDLSALVVEAVGDAHVAGPDHHWRLDLPEEPVLGRGDAARLHQVLGNLLANARTHTPAGTTVTVGLRPGAAGGVDQPGAAGGVDQPGAAGGVDQPGAAGGAVLTVADDGPGIPEHLLPHIFQRFARGDSSRSRAAGSTGLGLAIVDAVVTAHHGRLGVASRPGHTVFTVRLPAGGPAEPGQRASVST